MSWDNYLYADNPQTDPPEVMQHSSTLSLYWDNDPNLPSPGPDYFIEADFDLQDASTGEYLLETATLYRDDRTIEGADAIKILGAALIERLEQQAGEEDYQG